MSAYSKEFETEKINHLRAMLQKETNSFNIKPISFEVFKKTPAEREAVKDAKSRHKRSFGF